MSLASYQLLHSAMYLCLSVCKITTFILFHQMFPELFSSAALFFLFHTLLLQFFEHVVDDISIAHKVQA